MKKLLFIFLLSLVNFSHAQDLKSYEDYYNELTPDKSPYAIPMGISGDIASDLNFLGNGINPQELYLRYEKDWDRKLPLDQIEPFEDSTFYSPTFAKSQNDQNIQLQDFETVKFFTYKDSVQGDTIFRFSVRTELGKIYVLQLYRYNFLELIRKSLLRKMGYLVPASKYVSKLVINFSSADEQNKFIDEMKYYLGEENYANWVIKNNEGSLILKDLLAREIYDPKVDLSNTPKLFDETEGKRIFRAVVIPYNITNMNTTSINTVKWCNARIESANILLANPNTSNFRATLDDAKWGIKKLGALTRSDWADVVRESGLPTCLQNILVEKYIANRDCYVKLFEVDAPTISPSANTALTCRDEVLEGKVVKNSFESHVASFAYGDEKNPISQQEMSALFWSRVYQFGYDGLSNLINSIPYLATDISKINDDKFNELIDDAISRSHLSGKNENINFGAWKAPFYRAGVIVDRQIVAGSFLGTTNPVSRADTLGLRIGGGLFSGIAGILPDFNGDGKLNTIRFPFAQASLDAGVTYTISHIVPVNSIRDAFKEYKYNPLKKLNIFHEKSRLANILKPIFQTKSELELKQEDIDNFLKNFAVNESLIINLQGDTSAKLVGRLLTQFFQLDLGFRAQAGVMLRTHITRVDQNTIQIYKNNGSFLSPYGFDFKAKEYIPLVRYAFEKTSGSAHTEFFTLNLDPNGSNFKKNVYALYDVLKHGRFQKIYDLQKPYDLKFKFSQKSNELGLLIYSHNTLKQNVTIKIKSPQGVEKTYQRGAKSTINGTNYYDYALDAADALVYKFTNWNPSFSSGYTYRPSDQITGHAFVRSTTYEAELANNEVVSPTMVIERFYSGFKDNKERVEKRIKKIYNQYHHQFFNDDILAGVKQLFLYQVDVEFDLYPEAIQSVLDFPEAQAKELFRLNHNKVPPEQALSKKNSQDTPGLSRFLRLRKRVLKITDKTDPQYSKKLIKLMNHVDDSLTISGLIQIYGGFKNFFIRPKILGFRSNVEFDPAIASERSIFGNTIGIMRPIPYGPLTSYLIRSGENPGMREGELFINWLLKRP